MKCEMLKKANKGIVFAGLFAVLTLFAVDCLAEITTTDKNVLIGQGTSFALNVKYEIFPKSVTWSMSPWLPGATIDETTDTFFWAPTEAMKGTYPVTLTADHDGKKVSKTINLSTMTIAKQQITFNNYQDKCPVVHGDNVIYCSIRPDDTGIYSYDIAHGQENILVGMEGIDCFTGMVNNMLSGDDLYWEVIGFAYNSIYSKKVSDSAPVLYKNKARLYDTSDNAVVWEDQVSHAVYMQTRTMTDPVKIVERGEHLSMSGDRIVWRDTSETNKGIYWTTYNEENPNPVVYKCTDSAKAREPHISGDNIVWLEDREMNWELCTFIHVYSIIDKKITLIEHLGGDGKIRNVLGNIFNFDGDRVLYGLSNHTLYLFDIRTRQSFLVDNAAYVNNDPMSCRLSNASFAGNTIAWEKQGPGRPYREQWEIHTAKIYVAPVINEISVEYNEVCQVIIRGKDFGNTKGNSQVVFFDNKTVAIDDIISWTNTEIQCRVPGDAISGPVKVVTDAGGSNSVDVIVNNSIPSSAHFEPAGVLPTGEYLVNEKSITTSYTDNNGKSDLSICYLLIFKQDPGVGDQWSDGAHLFYNHQQQKFYVYDNNGKWTEAKDAVNSQVQLDYNGSKPELDLDGKTIRINWKLKFSDAFAGAHVINTGVVDKYSGVSFATPGTLVLGKAPTAGTLTPGLSTAVVGKKVRFKTTYRDDNGAKDVQLVQLLICAFGDLDDGLLSQSYVHLTAHVSNSSLWFYPKWGPGDNGWAGKNPDITGQGATLHCLGSTLTADDPNVVGDENLVTVEWEVSFTTGFPGFKDIYLDVRDNENLSSGWVKAGGIYVKPDPRPNAPTGLSGKGFVKDKNVNLSWIDRSNNETKFNIYQSFGGSYNRIASLGPNITNCTVRQPARKAYYKVSAVNGFGETYCTGPSEICVELKY